MSPKLLIKLINQLFVILQEWGVPQYLIRILHFWYSHQTMQARWCKSIPAPFLVTNGTRQGGILKILKEWKSARVDACWRIVSDASPASDVHVPSFFMADQVLNVVNQEIFGPHRQEWSMWGRWCTEPNDYISVLSL